LLLLVMMCGINGYAQIIRNADGTPLSTTYCFQDKNVELVGTPAGGTFQGCGVSNRNGRWIFNPRTASEGTTVFPMQCMIQYSVNGATANVPVTIAKPVVISPPLEDSFTCNGNIFLHASTLYAGAYQYAWSPAALLLTPHQENTPGFIDATQTFVVTATDMASGCKGSDTVTIIKDTVPVVTVSPDTTILPRTSAQMHASGAYTYNWSPAGGLNNPRSADPMASPRENTTYTVTGRSLYGCYNSASVTVRVNGQILVPNAFTPNGDGVNDVFRIVNYGFDQVMEFRIFNRWGKEVFSTTNGMDGWDGTLNGQPAATGTYYYLIRISHKDGGASDYRGDLTLVR